MRRSISRVILAFTFLSLLLISPMAAYAHGGRTDASGGHRDTKNASGLGSYHYHHGYPPHLHTDGVCPYNYIDKTDHSSSGSSRSSNSYSTTTTTDSTSRKPSVGYYIGIVILCLIFGLPILSTIVDGVSGVYEKYRKKPVNNIALPEPAQSLTVQPTQTAITHTRAVHCPRCGSAMRIRTGRYGRFYGCSRYPNCRGTRPL